MKVLSLDECGDHYPRVIDPQPPFLVLGGVLVDQDYAKGTLQDSLTAFKRQWLDNGEIEAPPTLWRALTAPRRTRAFSSENAKNPFAFLRKRKGAAARVNTCLGRARIM